MSKFDKGTWMNISMEKSFKDWIEEIALSFALEAGWNPETKDGKRPNNSAFAFELLQAGKEVWLLFGEDWRDHLQTQSKPRWAKELKANQLKILEIIENLETLPVSRKAEMVEEIKASIVPEVGGLIE